ncbi:histidine kinase [Spirosoma knui]
MNRLTLATLNDRWIRIIGIGGLWLLSLLTSGLLDPPWSSGQLIRMAILLGSITITWHFIRFLILFFRQKYFNRQDTVKRLLLTFLTGSLVSSLIMQGTQVLWYFLRYGSLANFRSATASITINNYTFSLNLYGFDLLQSALVFIFFQSIYEVLFFIQRTRKYQKRLKEAEHEQEKLRTVSLQSQLDALKQQVNPHFLFNSLNVLDSLIEDDPAQARVFLDELSTVYRYLLRSNDQHLTDLGTELDFIHSYFHLLKTRHGDGLRLAIAVDDRLQTYQLPPLTLQLLVENAVKHNIVLPEQPLCIAISTNGQSQLQVRNNLQRKTVRVASNGIGLTNIFAKYRMLNQPAPIIRESDGQFVVTLPLIVERP